MFRKMGDALRRFMYGRYGADSLNRALLILSVAFLLVGWLGGMAADWLSIFNLLAYIPLFWSIFRMYSRNIEARRKENAAWQRLLLPLKDRQNRYFKCPNCKQTVRVPKDKGKINIRCPKCQERFIRNT